MTTLHSIKTELTDQEKAIWALDYINPGQYTCVIQPDGSILWTHHTSRNTGILDTIYFVQIYNEQQRYRIQRNQNA